MFIQLVSSFHQVLTCKGHSAAPACVLFEYRIVGQIATTFKAIVGHCGHPPLERLADLVKDS